MHLVGYLYEDYDDARSLERTLLTIFLGLLQLRDSGNVFFCLPSSKNCDFVLIAVKIVWDIHDVMLYAIRFCYPTILLSELDKNHNKH